MSGFSPISYSAYFEKMGVTKTMVPSEGNLFIREQAPLLTINPETKEISFVLHAPLQTFLTSLGIQGGDVLVAVNNVNYNLDNINDLIIWSTGLKENDEVTFTIKRGGIEKEFSGNAILPQEMIPGYQFTEKQKLSLTEAWLKG